MTHNLDDVSFLTEHVTKSGDFAQLSGLAGTFTVYSDTTQSRFLIKNYTGTIQSQHILKSITVSSNNKEVSFDIPDPFKSSATSDFSSLGVAANTITIQTATSGNGQIGITLKKLQPLADIIISFQWESDHKPKYLVTASVKEDQSSFGEIQDNGVEFIENTTGGTGSTYKLTAVPKPNYAFNCWEYRTTNFETITDETVWSEWAPYPELNSASGSVTVTAHTQFRACFTQAQFSLSDDCLLYWASAVDQNKLITPGSPATEEGNGALSYNDNSSWYNTNPSPTPAVPGDPCFFEFQWDMTGPIRWTDGQANLLVGRVKLFNGTDTSAAPAFDSGQIYLTYSGTAAQVLSPHGSAARLNFVMPKAEYLTLTFEVEGFEPQQRTYSTGLSFALENALEVLDEEFKTLANLRYRYFIDAVLNEASQSAQPNMTEDDIAEIVDAARAEILAYINGSNDADIIEVCFNDTLVFTETGIPQSEAFKAAMELVYPREKGYWYLDCAGTTFGLWVNGWGGRAFTESELGEDGIAHTADDGTLETAIKTPSKTFAVGEPLPESGLIMGSQVGNITYNVNGLFSDFGLTGWLVSDNEIYTWGPSDAYALYKPLYSLEHIINTDSGYMLGDRSDETALLWAIAYLHRIGVTKAEILTAISMTDTSELTAAELYEMILAAYPQCAVRLSRDTATDMDKIPSVVAAYEAINAIDGLTGDELLDAVIAARAAYNSINLNGQTGLKTGFLQAYFGSQEPYKTAHLKLLAAEQELGIEPPEQATPEEALEGVLDYLAANVTNPVVGSDSGEWAVLTMARGGEITDTVKNAYLANLDTAIAENKLTSYTDYERVTLALSALGIDASKYGTTPIDMTSAYKTYVSDPTRTVNADIFALIALNAKPYTGDQSAYVAAICEAALENGGGWTLSGTTADVDTTAMAIQALAPYYDSNDTVKKKVDEALEWLHTKQDAASGGFKNYNGTVSTCSTAQVVTALCALGIDPDGAAWTVNEMTPLSALTLWYNEAGYFGESDTGKNQMSTEQAAYALVAWDRYKNNQRSLYDMGDAFPDQQSDDASVQSLTVCGVDAVEGETAETWTVELAYDTILADLEATDFDILPALGAKVSDPVSTDGGVNWNFTVTAENGTTTADYTVTVSLAENPNAANKEAVEAAIDAIGQLTLKSVASETANTAEAVRNWISAQITDSLTAQEAAASVTVAPADFVAAVDGTQTNKPGTSGSFKGTITVSKGEAKTPAYYEQVIEITDGVITPKVFVSSDATVKSVTCNEKPCTISGQTITVTLPCTTEALPASAEAFVIEKNDADATVSDLTIADGGATWTFTVTAEDGTTTLEYTIQVSIAEDSKSEAEETVSAIKTAIENHTFTVSSETANSEEDVLTWLQAQVDTLAAALDGKTVTDLTVTPAVDGAAGGAETWAGTPGRFSFTVSLSQAYGAGENTSGEPYEAGTLTDTTGTITGTITPVAYTPSPSTAVVSLTVEGATVTEDAANHSFDAVLPFGSELSSVTKDSFAIEVAAGADITAEPTVEADGKIWTFTVTAEDGETEQQYTVIVSISTDDTEYVKAQNQAAVDAAADVIPTTLTASYRNVSNTNTAKTFVLSALGEQGLDESVTPSVTISNFIAAKEGTESNPNGTDGSFTAKVTLSKGADATLATAEVTVNVTIKAPVDPNTEITVTFRLVGAYPADQPVDMSVSDDAPDYVTWIPTTEYTVAIGSTMYDLFTKAMEDAGLECEYKDQTHGYVATVYAPDILTGYALSEKTNGAYSGWMYSVNGSHPGIGLNGYYFSSDDSIVETGKADVVWHYVNDFNYEVSDWEGGSQGSASYWNKWLDAPNAAAVPATSIELSETSLSLVEEQIVNLTAEVTPSYALVTWSSSDEGVATVDASGKVIAISEGTATITASSVAGEESAACEVTVTAPEVPVTGVALDKNEVSVDENKTVTLNATISPDNSTIRTVNWSSSDEDVATVDENGVITGVKAGTATITASAGGESATCEVTVNAAVIPVSDVTLNRDTTTVAEAGTVTLTATVVPSNATNPTVTWTSSDESVATVVNGLVTGVKAGTATITASAGDKSASCVVTVEAEPISEFDPENVLAGVLGYLKGSVTNPAVSSTGGEWAVLAMARGGVITDAAGSAYLANLDSRLANTANPITQYTDYERITIALSALGVNASAYGEAETDLTEVYKAFVDPSERSADNQTLMADIFALIALDTKPYDSEARDAYISCILDAEKSGGGWNHAKASTTADVDTTAMALQALAPYYGKNEDVTKAVDRALSWLKAQQDPYTGGYGKSGVVNTESTAQVVATLCALNIDPAGTDWTVDDMNPLSALTSWYNTQKGWFGHTGATFDQMATEQAAYALVAWKRWTDKENSLYDMSDAFVASGDASVRSLTVCGIAAAAEDNSFTVILPYGTDLADLSASDFSIRPAAGAKNSSPVTTDGGKTWSFTVTAENGTTKQSYTVQVSVAADPLSGSRQTVSNVKSAIENHTFTVSSETANTKKAIAAWLQAEVDDLAAALDGRTVTGLTVTPAVNGEAGSSETWAGTDGSFSFTVALSLAYEAGTDESGAAYEAGTIEDVTAAITGNITAQSYTPSADAGVVSLSVNVDGAAVTADTTNHSFAAVLPYGTELDSLTKDSFTLTLAAGATGTDPVTKDGGATWTFTVTAEDGVTIQKYTVSVSVSDDDTEVVKAQNEAAVAAVKDEIPTTMTASAQEVSNAQNAKSYVLAALAGLELDDTVTRSVKISGFAAAEDGDKTNPDGTDGGFTATVTLTKGEGETLATVEAVISVTVAAKAYVDPNETITVSFRLIGAYPAEKDVDLSKSDYAPDYVTWIPTTEYTIAIGSTMYDLFTMAMEDAGLTSIGAESGYVETIYAPDVLTGYELSEFTNGTNSGWMYTVNGKTAGVGLKDYRFSSDEEIAATHSADVVWHYVNDYNYEVSDWETGSQGNASTWDKWLEAPDVAPKAVPATSIELDLTDISLTENETVTLTATVLPSYALVTWTSSDEDVATVDASGVVTGVSAGTAMITAKAGTVSATCEVTVTAAEIPEENIEIVGGSEDEPVAEVTSSIETSVNDEGEETKTATLTVVSETTNSAGEVVDNPCVVIVKNPDGSYEKLEAEENPDGGYDYVKEDYTEDMEFIVAVEGDYTGDGEFKTIDLAKANLDIIGKKDIDPVKVLIMGSANGKLRTIDLAKLNLILVNEEQN